MKDGMKEDSEFREVNAVPFGNDVVRCVDLAELLS